ncbi:MAG: laccase domain-containing protein, partial [Proteobacteria bacterium]|nr:laccase domain-containing protein [Pseudomonadota bacterium]
SRSRRRIFWSSQRLSRISKAEGTSMGCIEEELCGAPWIYSAVLHQRGILHGFVGKPFDFGVTQRQDSARRLLEALSASDVAMLRQVHGRSVLQLPQKIIDTIVGEGDGIMFPLHTPGRAVLVGVRSADCVPLILIGREFGAVVHAGWRGLAARIITQAVEQLRELESEQLSAFIGPCAGAARYEVGAEVLEAIGASAVATPSLCGRALLSLTATALAQLSELGVTEVCASERCTISDPRLHSFRRDGAPVGNNLTFVCTRP